jgi:hypothetical protein
MSKCHAANTFLADVNHFAVGRQSQIAAGGSALAGTGCSAAAAASGCAYQPNMPEQILPKTAAAVMHTVADKQLGCSYSGANCALCHQNLSQPEAVDLSTAINRINNMDKENCRLKTELEAEKIEHHYTASQLADATFDIDLLHRLYYAAQSKRIEILKASTVN